MSLRVDYIRDTAARWRWRLIAGNGLIVADSGQGYASRAGASRAYRRLLAQLTTAHPDPGPDPGPDLGRADA